MRKRRQKIWKPVVFGFTLLYLVIMGLSTWLVELKFQEEFKNNITQQLTALRRQLEEAEDIRAENYLNYFTAQAMSVESSDPFQQFSAAVYTTDGKLLARSENILELSYWDESGSHYRYHDLEGLTAQERRTLAEYGEKSYNSYDSSGAPAKYRILIRELKDSGELCQILVQEITWAQEGSEKENYTDPLTHTGYSYETAQGKNYYETDSKIVWRRNYPEAGKKAWKKGQTEILEPQLLFPYLIFGGYERWQQWDSTEYLQGFEDQIAISSQKIEDDLVELSVSSFQVPAQGILYHPVWTEEDDDTAFYLALRFENRPWPAAVNYMKYAYLIGLPLMLICIGKIIHTDNKISRQRAALEEMRRDFTNAMAHELKTPLSVIRGFAENLLEHNMEEKRDYYLTQIIRQTEEMDRLTAEMITISKMDSQHLVLQKESLSLSELIREQMARLEPVVQDKNLQVQYSCDKDFMIEGDRGYLAKAVWNLLSNAAVYNIPDGRIFIQTDTKSCIIENTGDPLSQEQLDHAFDLFYTGDKSRNSSDRHMGIGLFLTRKILRLHHLEISLENVRTGIRATIRRNSNNS